jgi:hypothetical protein
MPDENLDILISAGEEKKIKFADYNKEEIIVQYLKSEVIYKLLYLPNSEKFKICGINYGNGRSIFLWGQK